MIINLFIATIFDILKKDEDKNLCKKLKKDMKKFQNKESKYKNILDNYNFLCNNYS